jgi:shikimate kinase
MSNIILIGMPGSGKSTLGVLLAKALGYSFTDTDLIISRMAQKPLQRILDEDGLDSFLRLEEEVGGSLQCDHTVVATGGSMVVSEVAMRHLRGMGRVVYIDVPFEEIERRVTNITTRGIAFHKNETLRNVYEARKPLYERQADVIVQVTARDDIEATVARLSELLG